MMDTARFQNILQDTDDPIKQLTLRISAIANRGGVQLDHSYIWYVSQLEHSQISQSAMGQDIVLPYWFHIYYF